MQWVIQIQCIRIFPNKLLKLTQKILKFLEQQGKNFLYFTHFSSQNKISSEDILPGLRVSGCGDFDGWNLTNCKRRPFNFAKKNKKFMRLYDTFLAAYSLNWILGEGSVEVTKTNSGKCVDSSPSRLCKNALFM